MEAFKKVHESIISSLGASAAVLGEPISGLLPTFHAILEGFGVGVAHIPVLACLTGRTSLIVSRAIEYDLLALGQCTESRSKFIERYGAFEMKCFELLLIVVSTDEEGSTRFQFFSNFFWADALRLSHFEPPLGYSVWDGRISS